MTADWHRPVAAVLDALNLHDVALVGISLSGCLAIRAAALEPRVHRVVAFDVLSNFFTCAVAQLPRAARVLVRSLAAIGANGVLDGVVNAAARRRPVLEWGLAQALHVFGCDRPADALRAMRALHTRTLSAGVRQDVLLLAGANDHYVPLSQLWDQARLLSGARSLTARVFGAEEKAQAHCQVGTLPLAISTISAWSQSLDERDACSRGDESQVGIIYRANAPASSQGTGDGGGTATWRS